MSIIFRVRNEEKRVVAEQIESWKKAHDELKFAWQVEDLLQKILADRDEDEGFLEQELERASDSDREEIDEVSEFIHESCLRSIRIHDLVRDLIARAEKVGHPIPKADLLDKATADYRRWKEDYPDLLAMAYAPVRDRIQRRITDALADQGEETDWREMLR
jgi:hypothetical protein